MWDPFWTFGPMMTDYGAGRTAAEASTKANSAELRVRELEHRVERLAMACNAMWGLLRSQTGLTDQQLQAKIQQLDTAEGEGPRNMIQCANCGRHVSPRRGKCMYCGATCAQVSVFEE